MHPPARLQPALLGGIVLGVLAALPVVNMANLCCCAWAITGGLVAAWLLQQNYPAPIGPADGALVGLGAGAFGAVVWAILYVPIHLVTGPIQERMLERLIDRAGDLPPQFAEALANAQAHRGLVVGLVLGFLTNLLFYSIFGMLGGLLGAVLFRKSPPAVPPPGSWESPVPPIPPGPPMAPPPPPPPSLPE